MRLFIVNELFAINMIFMKSARYSRVLVLTELVMSGTYCKASFTRTINVINFVSSTFELFDGHFDNKIGCTIDFAYPSVRHY